MSGYYFDRAVTDAQAYRRRLMKGKDPALAPSVEVIVRIGSVTYPRCFLDSFEPGEITVTPCDPDSKGVTVYKAGEWLSANQVDALGYVEVSLKPPVEDEEPSMLRQVAG